MYYKLQYQKVSIILRSFLKAKINNTTIQFLIISNTSIRMFILNNNKNKFPFKNNNKFWVRCLKQNIIWVKYVIIINNGGKVNQNF